MHPALTNGRLTAVLLLRKRMINSDEHFFSYVHITYLDYNMMCLLMIIQSKCFFSFPYPLALTKGQLAIVIFKKMDD